MQVTAVLAAGVNVVSLLSLNYKGKITAWFDASITSGDYYFYGSVDSTTTLATQNLQPLGTVSVASGMNEPQIDINNALAGFPYLVVVSPGVATLYLEGGAAAGTPTLASVATPAAGAFASVMDLTAFDLNAGVTVMGSKAETSSDGFLVYGAQDSSVTDADGSVLLGTITGGSGSAGNDLVSLNVRGWPYVLIYRRDDDPYTGTTAGTIKAAGVLPGSDIGIPIDVNPTASSIAKRGADGSGWFTAAKLSANGGIVAADGRVRLANGAETIIGFRNAGDTGDIVALSKDGANNVTLGDATNGAGTTVVSGPASPLSITSGTTGALLLDSGTTGNVSLGTGASAKSIAIGNATGTTGVTVRSGSGGIIMAASGPGNVSISTNGTGAVTIAGGTGPSSFTASGNGTLALSVGASGTINIGTTPNAQTINIGTSIGGAVAVAIGSAITTSSTSLTAGTGGIGIGVAAPGGGATAVDAIQPANLDLGQTNSNRVRIAAAGAALGFFGSNGAVKQDVTGAKGGNAALTSLLAALAAYNIITDSTT